MDKQRRFYSVWLVLGLFQIITLQGCSNSAASSNSNALLSEDPPIKTTEQATNESNVRLSRAFFERSLTGKMQVTPANGAPSDEIESAVSWNENLSGLREAGGVAADHLGCALYKDLGVKLCFQIMSDVTSVGVNETDLKVTGLSKVASDSECNAPLQNVRFMQAIKNGEEHIEINFVGDRPQQDGCAGGPVLIKLSLRQI